MESWLCKWQGEKEGGGKDQTRKNAKPEKYFTPKLRKSTKSKSKIAEKKPNGEKLKTITKYFEKVNQQSKPPGPITSGGWGLEHSGKVELLSQRES